MRNRHLLKGGNDEALILAGSSDISFYKSSVVQAGLQAAGTGWRIERCVWFETACSAYSLWFYMAIHECIWRNCSVVYSWVSEVCVPVQEGPWGLLDGEPRVWLSMRKWECGTCCVVSAPALEHRVILHFLHKGRRLGYFWRGFEPQGAQPSGVHSVAKPALKDTSLFI